MDTKKNVFLWALYDFANSIVAIVFFLYFAQWVVIEMGVADFYFNITFTIAAVLLLFTAPFTGSLLDRYFRRISGLRYTTIFTMLFLGICSIFAVYNQAIWALVFFTLGWYSYLLSFTFYTPLINDISKPGKRGFVSGLGITANYLGQIAGLLLVLPISSGAISFFGSSPRAETLLPAVLVFFIFSLPMLIFFKEPKKQVDESSLATKLKESIVDTKILFSIVGVAIFLLSYFLFNDAVTTAMNNFSIFMEQVWGVSDAIKTYILLGILITSAIGGIVSGYIADKIGHKKTLMFLLFGWIILFPVIGFATNFTLFVVATSFMGFWFGAGWTVSRSFMSCIAPKGRHNLAFAFFGLVERASALVGPLAWGLIVSGLVPLGAFRYRIAALAMVVFIVLGILTLIFVKSDKKK